MLYFKTKFYFDIVTISELTGKVKRFSIQIKILSLAWITDINISAYVVRKLYDITRR